MTSAAFLSALQYPTWLSPFVFGPNYPMRWYGMMYLLGFLTAFLLLRWYIKRGNLLMPLNEEGGLYDLMFFIMLGVMVGGRIGNFILYDLNTFFTKPWEVLGFHFRNGKFSHFGLAGMSFHAGLLGTALLVIYFVRKYRHDFYNIADHMVIVAAPGLFFGRMGNFFNAELYGTKTAAWFGMKFPLYAKAGGYVKWMALSAAQRPYTAARHPSMLYEAILEGLVVFIILLLVYRKKPKRGVIMWMFIALYGLFRFSVEFVREPSIAWSLGWFTSGMVYSLPMFLFGSFMAWRRQMTVEGTTPPSEEQKATAKKIMAEVQAKIQGKEKKSEPAKKPEPKKQTENPASSSEKSSGGGGKKKKKKKKKKK